MKMSVASEERLQEVKRVIKENPDANNQELADILEIKLTSFLRYRRALPEEEESELPSEIVKKVRKIKESSNLPGSKSREAKLDELYEMMRDFSGAMESLDIVQNELETELDTKWMALIGLSDLHMGKKETNYDYIERLFDYLEKHENIRGFVNGDLVENWVNFSPESGGHDEILPPRYQIQLAEHKLEPVKDKLVCLIEGNHEFRSAKQGEIPPLERIASQLEIPYLGHGGRVSLKVNNIQYNLHLRHKFRYNSSLNPCHSCWRLVDTLDSEADIVCIGHLHNPAIGKIHKGGKWRSAIRYGSAYPSSEYEQYKGYQQTPLVAPVVVMSGKKKIHEPLLDLDIVEEYIS